MNSRSIEDLGQPLHHLIARYELYATFPDFGLPSLRFVQPETLTFIFRNIFEAIQEEVCEGSPRVEIETECLRSDLFKASSHRSFLSVCPPSRSPSLGLGEPYFASPEMSMGGACPSVREGR